MGPRIRDAVSHPVVAVGLGLVAVQLLYRVWAVSGSFFFTDDFYLLYQARTVPFSADYVFSDFANNLIPISRLIASTTSQAGVLDWGTASTFLLALQLAASLSCLLMLTTLFGRRWPTLALLALYLFSASTVPTFMWWAAALIQLPFHTCLFLAVTAWVTYLRRGGRRYFWLTALLVGLGMLAFLKGLLIVPVLAYLTLVYFTAGTPSERLRAFLGRHWPAIAVFGALSAAYLAIYLTSVDQAAEKSRGQTGNVVQSMLGDIIPTALVGGPWRWFETSLPLALAQPPSWTVHVSWVLIALLVGYTMLRRVRAAGGWVLIGWYAVAITALVAGSRGQLYGALAAQEYRYLTDIAAVAALGVGLAFLSVPGAVGSSEPREAPLLTHPLPRVVLPAVVAAITLGGIVSGIQYVGYWHSDNRAEGYVANLRRDLGTGQAFAMASQALPAAVMPPYTAPVNQSEEFVRLFDSKAYFPQSTESLYVLDPQGHVRKALLDAEFSSPDGPREGCGWRLDSPQTIPLSGDTYDFDFWLRIGYLAGADSQIEIHAGDQTQVVDLRQGLHDVYLQAPGSFDEIEIVNRTPGSVVCIAQAEVGLPVPGLDDL